MVRVTGFELEGVRFMVFNLAPNAAVSLSTAP